MNNSGITYIFRKKLPQFHSIEEVFGNIIAETGKWVPTETIHLPCSGGLTAVVKNLLSFRRKKGVIYHITGHDNYMALRTGRNTVLTIHDIGSAFTGGFFRNMFVKLFWFYIPAKLVSQITVISENSKNEVLKLMPFVKNKIQVIHNPLNPGITWHPYTFNSHKPTILFMGTKSNKNLEGAVAALENLPCRLLIIGKLFEEQKKLLQLAGIEYTNYYFIPWEEILQHYRDCDLLLFPAWYEGFGLPVLEAQAIGRPVITSNCSSLPEVAGEGACLVDPGSVHSIREGLLKVIGDEKFRNRIIEKGRENINRFRIHKIAKQYLDLYAKIR